MAQGIKIVSSLPLQICLFFNGWDDVIYFVMGAILFAYKAIMLPYPANVFGVEVGFFSVFCLVDIARLFIGDKGNKTEQTMPTVWFVVLSVITGIGGVYYMQLQVFVLFTDLILGIIYLAFVGAEILFGVFTAINFSRIPA
eukprot:TRINITY_DN7614_c0_g1_i1.p1 TRINITY_DN7614_c0_g1~~TRINITY_DN7614_c0_g1_i1.p1  ORF type:complete len:141 (+),score=14.54 TRINITY_DN7614_c0_g1_i1:138-560(+)